MSIMVQGSGPPGLPLKVWTGTFVSDALGAVSATLPAGAFTAIVSVTVIPNRDTAAPLSSCFAMLRTWSLTTVTAQVFESRITSVLLGGSIEGIQAATAPTSVMITVFGY